MPIRAYYVTVLMKPKVFNEAWKWLKEQEIEDNLNIFNRIDGVIHETKSKNILFRSSIRTGNERDNALTNLLRFFSVEDPDDIEDNDYKIIVISRGDISTFGSMSDESVRFGADYSFDGAPRTFTTTGELIENIDNEEYISDVTFDANRTPIHIRADKKEGYLNLSIQRGIRSSELNFDVWSLMKLQRIINKFMEPVFTKKEDVEEE
jgi:hypothetical protein